VTKRLSLSLLLSLFALSAFAQTAAPDEVARTYTLCILTGRFSEARTLVAPELYTTLDAWIDTFDSWSKKEQENYRDDGIRLSYGLSTDPPLIMNDRAQVMVHTPNGQSERIHLRKIDGQWFIAPASYNTEDQPELIVWYDGIPALQVTTADGQDIDVKVNLGFADTYGVAAAVAVRDAIDDALRLFFRQCTGEDLTPGREEALKQALLGRLRDIPEIASLREIHFGHLVLSDAEN